MSTYYFANGNGYGPVWSPEPTNLFTVWVWTGPCAVKQYADKARLHFAGCDVLEGTEHVWIRAIESDSIYKVEDSVRALFNIKRGYMVRAYSIH